MLTSSVPTNAASSTLFRTTVPPPPQARVRSAAARHGHVGDGSANPVNHGSLCSEAHQKVEISPSEIVKRHASDWHGMAAEIIQSTSLEKVEYRFHGPVHLLAAYDRAVRVEGEIVVEGLPRPSVRDLRNKFIFIPAGHEYYEWHRPRTLGRVAFFYFEPATLPIQPDTARSDLAARLYFEDAMLWDTVQKLVALIESSNADNLPYLEALGVVLSHEVARMNRQSNRTQRHLLGGLASWQQRAVTTYIEEHLAEQVPLTTLADLAGLSTFHFCRSFKQSFGMPPHRYHTIRRIQRAKMLLAKAHTSVTEVGLAVGFSGNSSFTTTFGKVTGVTPTYYRRSLG
jgi:AraC family transcriptional regulator